MATAAAAAEVTVPAEVTRLYDWLMVRVERASRSAVLASHTWMRDLVHHLMLQAQARCDSAARAPEDADGVLRWYLDMIPHELEGVDTWLLRGWLLEYATEHGLPVRAELVADVEDLVTSGLAEDVASVVDALIHAGEAHALAGWFVEALIAASED